MAQILRGPIPLTFLVNPRFEGTGPSPSTILTTFSVYLGSPEHFRGISCGMKSPGWGGCPPSSGVLQDAGHSACPKMLVEQSVR
jgi:hypothetical protein